MKIEKVVRTPQLPLFVFILIVDCVVSTVTHTGLTLVYYIFLYCIYIFHNPQKDMDRRYIVFPFVYIMFC